MEIQEHDEAVMRAFQAEVEAIQQMARTRNRVFDGASNVVVVPVNEGVL